MKNLGVYMEKLVKIFKVIAIFITIMIILNGTSLLVVYGFKSLFFILMLVEICLLILQFMYLRKSKYNKLINLVYIVPFPIVYLVTLLG